MLRPTLKPRTDLPTVESSANLAWREGWWTALPLGIVIGFAAAVIFLKG